MQKTLFVFFTVFLTAMVSHAQFRRCLSEVNFSSPCPTVSPNTSNLAVGELYKGASAVCASGVAKTISLQYCASKSLLAAKLERECVMARQCKFTRPEPKPRVPPPIELPHPIPLPRIPPKVPPPPVMPPETSNPTSPPVSVPDPVDNGGSTPPPPIVRPNEPPPPVMPPPSSTGGGSTPPPVLPPPVVKPPSEPPPVVVQPPAQPGSPITTNFTGRLTSLRTESNFVSVTWSHPELISNMCGTGINYIHYAKLDKNDSRNAAFLATYPIAESQNINVSLVCTAPRMTSAPASATESYSKTVYYTYPDGCYVKTFSAAARPPSCMIP